MRSKTLLWTVIVIVLLAVGVYVFRGRPTGGKSEIVVLSYGGEFADAQRAAYFQPFSKETGIPVTESSYNGEYGKLKAAVESGSVPWDVVDIESSMLLRGVKDNILLKLDQDKLTTKDILPAAIHPYGVATDFYSVSLGYNTKKFPSSGRHPENWKDFWDVKTFPGPRCLKKDPKFTLEIALMADGVPIDKIYEGGKLDVDRAFRSLDRIKPYVHVWWESGQQPIQLLSSGEVVMVAAFGARIFNAEEKEKQPVAVSWDQGILDLEYWVTLRGAPHADNGFRFIDSASRPDRQAEMSKHIPLGPVNAHAFDFMPPELAQKLNTYPDNYKKQLLLSAEYWGQNEEAIRERFNQWLGRP